MVHQKAMGPRENFPPRFTNPGVCRAPNHPSGARTCWQPRVRSTTSCSSTSSPSMSQTHTHGPGQPAHSHGPAAPQQPPPGAAQQQQAPKAAMPQPDPVMQAIIDASFVPVDIALSTPDNVAAQCEKHALEKCATCDVDFVSLNRLSRLLQMNPGLRCPPPPTLVSQKLSAAINNTKEEGNVRLLISSTLAIVTPNTLLDFVQSRSTRHGTPTLHHGCQFRDTTTVMGGGADDARRALCRSLESVCLVL